MERNDIDKILQAFQQYTDREEGKKYYHDEHDDFKIIVTKDNEVFQLDTDHEEFGVELKTLDEFKIRFYSFTGEQLNYQK